jgi:hypothetical protein
MINEFECPVCLSPSLVYPKALEDDRAVTCADCGAFVSTYGELKRRVERTPSSKRARLAVSGCAILAVPQDGAAADSWSIELRSPAREHFGSAARRLERRRLGRRG